MVKMNGASGIYGEKRNEYMKHLEHLGVDVRILLKWALIRNIVTVISWINVAVDKEQRLGVVHAVTNLTNTVKFGVCVCLCSFC
jgi:myosin heavy subunit